MARRFKVVADYEIVLDQTITIRDVLAPDHLARFIVKVISWLDLSAIKGFLPEITGLFAQVLHPKGTRAHELGILKLGTISVDGSKVHADASKSHAVSHDRLLQLEQRLHAEVEELVALAEKADQHPEAPMSEPRVSSMSCAHREEGRAF